MNKKERNPIKTPEPKFEKLFYLESITDGVIPVGDIGGHVLNIYPIVGGYFEGEELKGTIIPLGADWNYMHTDSVDITDTRYVLKTDDGAIISLQTRGTYIADEEKDAAIDRGEYVDPETYFFRQHLFFETGHEKYKWLNGVVAFGIMAIKPTGEVCYNAYRLV